MVIEKRLSCAIIDDEPLAQELMQKYASRLGYLELVATFDNAVEALGRLEALQPDIILLDVNMPHMNGIELLKTFFNFKPAIILTTAYPEYALDGFEYDVTDFILKPITFDRFVKAINKASEKIGTSAVDALDQKRMLLIKENKRFIRLAMEDVLFVEGMKDYLKIHTKTNVIVTHMTMTKIVSMLDEANFLRINRSYLVQKSAIKAITGNVVEIVTNVELPIGVNYRELIRKMTDKGML